jgi:hypothetical protein
VVAVLLALAALGTLQLTAFRTICNHTDTAWCAPLPHSAYPHQQWLHGTGTGVAFATLQLAVVACAWAAWPVAELRDLVRVSVVVEAIALPFTLWFLANAETTWHGLAEKVFLTALAFWTSYAGLRLYEVGAAASARHHARPPSQPSAGSRLSPSGPAP